MELLKGCVKRKEKASDLVSVRANIVFFEQGFGIKSHVILLSPAYPIIPSKKDKRDLPKGQ